MTTMEEDTTYILKGKNEFERQHSRKASSALILKFHVLADCCASHIDSTFPTTVALAGTDFHAVEHSHAEPCQDATHFHPKETEADTGGGHRQDEDH